MPPRQSLSRLNWTKHVLISLGLLFLTLSTRSQQLQEYEARALLVYNFVKSTSWPEGSFAERHSPIVIGIVGNQDLVNAFQKFQGKLIKGRPLEFEKFEHMTDFQSGHLLYISGEWSASSKFFIDSLRKSRKPILTVGEDLNFVINGGMISIIREDKHLALLTNPNEAKSAGLFLSNNLVKLSKQVSTLKETEQRY